MKGQLFIADARDFDAYPAANADVRRAIELLRRFLDQHFLNADCGRNSDGNVTVTVMVVREHGEDLLADKPGWLAMRNLLPGFRQGKAEAPHTFNLVTTVTRFGCWCHIRFQLCSLRRL